MGLTPQRVNLLLPYWLLNSEELEELFIDTEANDHKQRSIFKETVVSSKKNNNTDGVFDNSKIHYDSPVMFDINEVITYIKLKNEEKVEGANGKKQGPLFGEFTNFISRLEQKVNDKRLDFLLAESAKNKTFAETLKNLLSYEDANKKNITIINLSGIPFEVLSITVSLISRILFDLGYYLKRTQKNPNICPLLVVYEEAHKYVPKSDLRKYRSSKHSIERIAKEGRKYGVTLGIISQRPSEISETIFSQCSNFVVMRLTNPEDQNYVKRLLPDSMGSLTDNISTFSSGEALLVGDSIVLPSLVNIDHCDPTPNSSDIPYFEIWKEEWLDPDFIALINQWNTQ